VTHFIVILLTEVSSVAWWRHQATPSQLCQWRSTDVVEDFGGTLDYWPGEW